MPNEFSILAPEQEKELKDIFIVMMNMQHYSQNPQTLQIQNFKFKYFLLIINFDIHGKVFIA